MILIPAAWASLTIASTSIMYTGSLTPRPLFPSATLADQVVGMHTPDAPASVSKALTDALLDLDWIRSKCMLPTSTRLHWYLEEQGLPLPGT